MSFLRCGKQLPCPPGSPEMQPQCRPQRSLPAAGVPPSRPGSLHLYGQALLVRLRLCHTWPRGPACREGSRGGRWRRPDGHRPGSLLGPGHAPPLPRTPGAYLTQMLPSTFGSGPFGRQSPSQGKRKGGRQGPMVQQATPAPLPRSRPRDDLGLLSRAVGGGHVHVQPPMGSPGSAWTSG